ncbi:MAG: ABC transporter ATP-binding protein [Ardenticatenaceae bacterium]|nr:ABC transporter ATP-binding protein [Anaerolineales bacterium]MCB8922620.1 ABC transporter ATP-binding protein [Ardenticatenaceae bacterium]MCB8991288.1 ABC transporter ATP-binding protein [Ardenticatenaceae bacterium]MCB9003671.1 ABC transporter ATP-binding protein [Ardenticatenaceae bacterium]
MLIYDIRHLTHTYPGQTTPANDDVSLQIAQGEIFGLLGDNGAGKSTLVKQMVNLLAPTVGEIVFMARPFPPSDPTAISMNVGYMPQDGLAFNSLTVAETLYFTAHLRGLSRRDACRERERLLEMWQLGPLRGRIPGKLSGGQRRLLQIAATMAGQPPVLILDEPTNHLDPQRRQQVWQALRQLNRDNGTTIIFITHDAIEAEKIIQRVGIMSAGRLVALGKPSDLKRQVDNQLRLELFFPPQSPPPLPANLRCHELDAGRWLVYLRKEEATAVLHTLDLTQLDDFRLHSATLEDLYMHYVNGGEHD